MELILNMSKEIPCSIQSKNANVKGVVVNKSNVQDAANVAVGIGNKANMGSIVVE